MSFRATICTWRATSIFVGLITVGNMVPVATETKTSDGLQYFLQLAFNTVKSLFMSTNDYLKGLHSMLFAVRVVDCISVVFHQTKIVKALISIDVLEAIDTKKKLCSQCRRINVDVDREN